MTDRARPLSEIPVYLPPTAVGRSLLAAIRRHTGHGFPYHSESSAGPKVIPHATVARAFAAGVDDQEAAIRPEVLATVQDRSRIFVADEWANIQDSERKVSVDLPCSSIPHEQVMTAAPARTGPDHKVTREVRRYSAIAGRICAETTKVGTRVSSWIAEIGRCDFPRVSCDRIVLESWRPSGMCLRVKNRNGAKPYRSQPDSHRSRIPSYARKVPVCGVLGKWQV
jgi:hypothetical protein